MARLAAGGGWGKGEAGKAPGLDGAQLEAERVDTHI